MRRSHPRSWLIGCAAVVSLVVIPAAAHRDPAQSRYRVEPGPNLAGRLQARFGGAQLELLEKLNRADVEHLDRLPLLVLPEEWGRDELAYSPLPLRYESGTPSATFVVAYLPGQVFAAYEFGFQVRWGPISSGRRSQRTPAGLFALNWRSAGRASTVNPEWFMRWYFNFDNTEGLAFHAYSLPGYPASHGCIRLLERDARWLFDWGQGWKADRSGTAVVEAGTPVLIVGQYDFDAPPPWRSLSWLGHPVALPVPPVP